MTCPICGDAMERGWLLCGLPCVWTPVPSGGKALWTGGFAEGQGDIRLPRDDTGRPAAWCCRSCRKLLIDLEEQV